MPIDADLSPFPLRDTPHRMDTLPWDLWRMVTRSHNHYLSTVENVCSILNPQPQYLVLASSSGKNEGKMLWLVKFLTVKESKACVKHLHDTTRNHDRHDWSINPLSRGQKALLRRLEYKHTSGALGSPRLFFPPSRVAVPRLLMPKYSANSEYEDPEWDLWRMAVVRRLIGNPSVESAFEQLKGIPPAFVVHHKSKTRKAVIWFYKFKNWADVAELYVRRTKAEQDVVCLKRLDSYGEQALRRLGYFPFTPGPLANTDYRLPNSILAHSVVISQDRPRRGRLPRYRSPPPTYESATAAPPDPPRFSSPPIDRGPDGAGPSGLAVAPPPRRPSPPPILRRVRPREAVASSAEESYDPEDGPGPSKRPRLDSSGRSSSSPSPSPSPSPPPRMHLQLTPQASSSANTYSTASSSRAGWLDNGSSEWRF
ncbi:hypothetical protein FRB90_011731 [Tulasnella sp. 427]|nr:hypothetical protein FRB90_011731 [Tulasnella sp. 427]